MNNAPLSITRESRIKVSRKKLVLDCALSVFATYGFHGATIDQIASMADLSKPNVLYYFESKEHIYKALLERTLEGWLNPFIAIDPFGDPMTELKNYVAAKIDMSFNDPLQSRLFAMEVMNGAPQMLPSIKTSLRNIVDEKARVFQAWMDQGKLKQVDPHHLIFSIWSVTQHYADFAIQIEAILDKKPDREGTKTSVIAILLGGLEPPTDVAIEDAKRVKH
jgi:TetR/AcrR family transcriptional regulator